MDPPVLVLREIVQMKVIDLTDDSDEDSAVAVVEIAISIFGEVRVHSPMKMGISAKVSKKVKSTCKDPYLDLLAAHELVKSQRTSGLQVLH